MKILIIINNDYESLKEELGDLLLHVVFQADLAEDTNNFSIEDSIDRVNKKLISRHPHIFDNKNNTILIKTKKVHQNLAEIITSIEKTSNIKDLQRSK